MPRSIIGWFVLCWSAFLIVALAVGGLLVSLYDQTTAAQIRRGEAAVENGCAAVAGRVSFLLAGGGTLPAPGSAALDRGLHAAVVLALRGERGVQGGVWSLDAGDLAAAAPGLSVPGLSVAERATVQGLAERAVLDGAAATERADAGSRVVLAAACPLPVAVPHLAGWTLLRVETAGGSAYLQAAGGLGILVVVLLASAAWLGVRLRFWGARLRRLEAALAQGESLPALAPTGQRDLDRIIAALNGAGARLAAARSREAALAGEVARSERLAALGRIAAGVAHEVRNPIAAMRLRAENALAAGTGAGAAATGRQEAALRAILTQIARLDALTRDLLGSGTQAAPWPRTVADVRGFLAARLDALAEAARASGVVLSLEAPEGIAARFDPERIGRAIDNLVLNAVQNTPHGGRVLVAARRAGESLQLSVSDTGRGVPPALRPHLFEPFVTGRPDGTGLGLAIVRETVEAHGGRVRALHPQEGTTITIDLPLAGRPISERPLSGRPA
ncbi:MAG TPA: HAMP domain-containing sensor histidine kinase [Acetobacteraceae bacterium]|nr:HAMP domain-containing sensor histidine kinase [Acetobacteraceae bacterium]